jgi:uncharacterized protein
MSALYRQKLAAKPGKTAQLKSQQRDFLLKRDQCRDVVCVVKLYQ